jgi:hypothetical protein
LIGAALFGGIGALRFFPAELMEVVEPPFRLDSIGFSKNELCEVYDEDLRSENPFC